MPAQMQIIEIKIIYYIFLLFSFHITSICVHKCILKQHHVAAPIAHTFHDLIFAKGFNEKSRNDKLLFCGRKK